METCGEARGKAAIVKVVEEVRIHEHFDETSSIGEREYLPLEVWKRKGFPWKKIRRNDDKHECPIMGTVYGALIRSKRNEEGHKNLWRETVGATSPTSAPSHYSSPRTPA